MVLPAGFIDEQQKFWPPTVVNIDEAWLMVLALCERLESRVAWAAFTVRCALLGDERSAPANDILSLSWLGLHLLLLQKLNYGQH